MDQVIAALALWVATALGVPALEPMPTVEFRTVTELNQLYGLTAGSGSHDDVAALYDHVHDRIYLDETLDLTKRNDQSYLVHELVHAVQAREGRTMVNTCIAFLEQEAYAVQARFLTEHGETDAARLHWVRSAFLSAGCEQR